MAIRTIIKKGNSFLRKKSRDVSVFDGRLHVLLDDMADTMRQANGVGLAAVQVGVLRRVVVVDVGEDLVELVNPVIVETSDEIQSGPEGCLSFPGDYALVERPMRVKVQAQNRHGDLFYVEGEGLKARALCHEIDHLNGVLFADLAKEMLDGEEEE